MAHVKICKINDCKNAATTRGYCRFHYLRHWREIHEIEKEKAQNRLDNYIDAICREHPGDFTEVIREHLKSPDFDDRVEDVLCTANEYVAGEPALEEEIERLIRELKVESGF
jgi:hypothetical protein